MKKLIILYLFSIFLFCSCNYHSDLETEMISLGKISEVTIIPRGWNYDTLVKIETDEAIVIIPYNKTMVVATGKEIFKITYSNGRKALVVEGSTRRYYFY